MNTVEVATLEVGGPTAGVIQAVRTILPCTTSEAVQWLASVLPPAVFRVHHWCPALKS